MGKTVDIIENTVHTTGSGLSNEVVDSLNSTKTNVPLSANQGKQLQDTKIGTDNTDSSKLGNLNIGQEISIASWSYSGTAITVNTSVDHNLKNNDYVYIQGLTATTNAPNGRWQITVSDNDTFTFTAIDTPTGTEGVSNAAFKSGVLKAFDILEARNHNTAVVVFDGSTTPPTIKHSSNVRDVVKQTNANYRVEFEEDMDNTDFSANVSGSNGTTRLIGGDDNVKTVSYIEVGFINYVNSDATLPTNAVVTVYGGKG